jgi:hypothetical protein
LDVPSPAGHSKSAHLLWCRPGTKPPVREDRPLAVPPTDLLVEGQAALDAADWARAKAIFEESLAKGEEPEALDGLGQALWWLRDLEGCLRQRERAYGLAALR